MILCQDGHLVNNRFFGTISTHRVFSFHSTVAISCRHDLIVQNGFVVVVDVLFDLCHATVTDLVCVSVKCIM